ncbi:MAG: CIA30 family protein [Candidatus Aminicenantales bacterium]
MRKKWLATCGAAALVFAAVSTAAPASGSQTPEVKVTVINNVRVFDGEKVIPSATVMIAGNKIAAVGAAPIPAWAEIIDGAGKTLLPGLIDSHVHIWDENSLRQAAVFGVTVLVDMFTSVDFAAAVKKAQDTAAGPRPLSYLVSSMTLATVTGGHGTEYGLKIPTIGDPGEAQAFVDARIAEGSDFIKIIYDDGKTYGFALPTLSRETMTAIIRAAHLRNKLAIVHAASLKDCREALEAGADGLAHLHFDDAFDPDFGKLAAVKKAFVIPTFSVLASMNGSPDLAEIARDAALVPYLKEADLELLRRKPGFGNAPGAYAASEKTLKQLKEAGVPILAGTDTSNPGTAFGAALHGELELLVKAGLTPVEALRSATSVPADIFRLKGRGRIVPGGRADLVLVEGDPTSNIKATRAIVAVWKDGARIDRDAYRREVEEGRRVKTDQKNAPAPEGLGDGWISDFEGDQISSRFGAGWMVSTDAFMGGKSTAEISLTDGGAEGSRKALLIKGAIAEAGSIRWAAAAFSPGKAPMTPANLSSKKALSFWAKGEGKMFAVTVYAQSLGFIPKVAVFEAGPEWKEYVFPFEKLGLEGYDIMAIALGATTTPGEFKLMIDNVRLK